MDKNMEPYELFQELILLNPKVQGKFCFLLARKRQMFFYFRKLGGNSIHQDFTEQSYFHSNLTEIL